MQKIEIWNQFIDDTYPIVRQIPIRDIPAESDRFIVTIEPRQHPHLEYVLRNVIHFLGPQWGLQIFSGRKNYEFVQDMVKGWGNAHVYRIETDDLSTIEYNQVKKSPGFWNLVKGERVLWVEPDCMLCHGDIDEFLEYDYVGAPWQPRMAVSLNCRVGNGGLSLRSTAAMREIANTCNTDKSVFGTEDVFFVVNMQLSKDRYRIPPVEVAKKFSVESVYYERPFGLHKAYKFLTEEQLRSVLSNIRYDV